MIFEVCAGLTVIASIIVILYLLTRSGGPISIERMNEEGNVRLKIKANKSIKCIEVKSGTGEERLSFVRRDLIKDETVEFLIPTTTEKLELIITDENGTKTTSI
jgi:hypothetical protein